MVSRIFYGVMTHTEQRYFIMVDAVGEAFRLPSLEKLNNFSPFAPSGGVNGEVRFSRDWR